MKKVILAAAVLVASASVANAEGYNRVALSYDWQHYSMNKDYTGTDKTEGRSLNGFGINYAHGFGVAENMFVEVGGTSTSASALKRAKKWNMPAIGSRTSRR